MSWQKCAWLLCGDQVCLAIMAQTWSLSVLGWVPGIITMVLAAVMFYFTSLTMHTFIMKNPQIKDICACLPNRLHRVKQDVDIVVSLLGALNILDDTEYT